MPESGVEERKDGGAAGEAGEEQLTEQQVIARFRGMRQQCQQIAQKIAELEMEQNEHRLVIETLTGLDDGRKAFRMVGGVLVERTVGEVLPSVQQNLDGLADVLTQLQQQLDRTEAEAQAFQNKYGIRTQADQGPKAGGVAAAAANAGVLA